MLPKRQRISHKDIENIIKLGKNFHTDNFYGKFFLNKLKKPRFAVVIPTYIEKKSTKRHLLKRRVLFAVEKFKRDNPKILNKSLDLIIFLKNKALFLNFSQISLEINRILEHTPVLF